MGNGIQKKKIPQVQQEETRKVAKECLKQEAVHTEMLPVQGEEELLCTRMIAAPNDITLRKTRPVHLALSVGEFSTIFSVIPPRAK
jgi:predicted transcriptional regulator